MYNTTIKRTALFLATWLMSLVFASAVEAGTIKENNAYSDLFSEEQSDLNLEFMALNELESSIASLDFSDLNSVKKSQPNLLENLGLENIKSINSTEATQGFTIDDMDWGSFAWGILCCPIGFFVVAINKNKSKEQKTSFWVGWATGVVINILYSASVGFSFGN